MEGVLARNIEKIKKELVAIYVIGRIPFRVF